MYSQQQSKWYPQRCLLAHFEATLDFSRSEFTFFGGGQIPFFLGGVPFILLLHVLKLNKQLELN